MRILVSAEKKKSAGGRCLRAPFQVLLCVRFTDALASSLCVGASRGKRGIFSQRACVRDARGAPRLALLVAPAARARRRMAVAAKTRTRETKKEEEASSETRPLRVGARGVRADAIEMRTFSWVLPLRSDANMRAARFAVRNPPFARRGSVHSRARRSTYTKYRPTALTNLRPSVQLADG